MSQEYIQQYFSDPKEEIDLRDYWRVTVRRKWTIISVFVLIVTIVTIHTFKMRPIFQATTRVLIDKENPNIVSIDEVMELDAGKIDYYQTQYNIIQSRQLIEKVIDELSLVNSPEFLADPLAEDSLSLKKITTATVTWIKDTVATIFPSKPASSMAFPTEEMDPELKEREHLFRQFFSRLTVTPIKNSRLVDISFTGHSPKTITKIVNQLALAYIVQNLDIRLSASEDAVDWLDERLKTVRDKVESSAMALQRYREESGIVSFEEKQNIIDQKLAELNTQVTAAKKGRISIETRYKSSLDPTLSRSLPTIIDNKLIQQLNRDLVAATAQLSQLQEKYGPEHPNVVQLTSKIDTLNAKMDEEIKKIHESIYTEYQTALAAEKSLVEALEDQKREAIYLNKKSIRYGVLKREADSNQEMYDLLLKRLKETGLSTGLRSNNIRIIDPAVSPVHPIRPNKKMNLLLAVLIGLFGGVGLAFAVEYIDNSIKDPDEITIRFGIPFLGLVGCHGSNRRSHKKDESGIEIISVQNPSSAIAESLRTIRTNVVFSTDGDKDKTIAITSALPSEGKTTICANLAAAMASLGEKVLVVDSDLRKPAIHRTFKINKTPGLSNYLINQNSLEEIIKDTSVENLYAIPSGISPPNPAELLSHPQLKKLIDTAMQSYDRILFDTSPVGSVTDPLIVSRLTKTAIVVVRCGSTPRDSVDRALKQLKATGANIIGAILNDVDFRKDSYYYQYYYKHYYYQENA